MNYEQFKSAVIDFLSQNIPDPKTITVHPVMKNNGVRLDGLIVLEGDSNYSPTIYLDSYYTRYEAGMTFETLCLEILEMYTSHRTMAQIDTDFFMDYQKIRDRLAFKLIHARRNAELLKDVPHIAYLDLAIVFYCLLDHTFFDDTGTILIHNSHLELWQIDCDTLLRDARRNTPLMLPKTLRDIRDVLADYADEGTAHGCAYEPEDSSPPISGGDGGFHFLVLTNRKNLFGAACILYDGLLAQIADRLESDLVILPSSVHEVLILPAGDRSAYAATHRMVEDVNEAALLPDEILSDHAYYYSRRERRVSIEAC